jgi:hypothetical protein
MDFVLLDADGLAEAQTAAYVTYDDQCIYIGFECDGPHPGGVATLETEHDALVCHDDCIDVFLDLNRDYKNYFHFIINSKGVTSDASVELLDDFIDVYYDWEPEYEAEASVGENCWYVELALPFASLKTGIARPTVFEERKEQEQCAFSLLEAPVVIPGTVWHINLARRKQSQSGEVSSWPAVCDKFYSPYQFGHLIFADGIAANGVTDIVARAELTHRLAVQEKNQVEQDRLQPVLDEISAYVPGCEWTAVFRWNMFLGYESNDGKLHIPNYARRDGQGRVVLQEAIPPLRAAALDTIIAKPTPRYVFDADSLAELRGKIESNPSVREQWLKLKDEADELLAEPMADFEPCEMQWDRNCVSREKAKSAGAGYGSFGSTRTKCALAYGITQDRKYAAKAWEAQRAMMAHYDKYQVFRAASNWYSIWDASYEMHTSTYTYDMIAHSGVLTDSDKAQFIEFIRKLAHSVNYCVAYSEMVGNHQYMWTGNFGCMVAYFPEFPEHDRWQRDVDARMPMLYADILNDGGQVERSPGHHIFGLNFLCRYVIAMKQLLGEDIFAHEYDGKSLEMALDWMAKITTPLGEIPAINDSKRPMLAKHTFMLDIINRFDRGDYLRAGKIDVTDLPLEHLIAETVQPVDPGYTSAHLPDTGWAVMRDGWDKDSRYLLFDYGAHGAWHGHFDKMNIVMYADGVGWVLDAGASPHYCVYIKEHNEWHKQTIAHNTVLIDHQSQDGVVGTLRRWESQAGFDMVSASHDGYEGISHTRTVFHPRDEYFIISDFLESSGSLQHDYSWLLHVYGEPGEISESLISFRKDGKGLLVLPADPGGILSVDLDHGLCIDTISERQEPLRDDGTWTPGDPGWGYIPYIALNKSTDATEVSYIVVLYPYVGAEQPAPQCTKLHGGNGNALGIRLVHGDYTDIYGERKPSATEPREIKLDGFITDAECFFVRIKDGDVVKAFIIGGTSLSWNGVELAVEAVE